MQPVQRPGAGHAEEIAEFCSTTYGVTFPLSEKIDVNGENRHPIYEELTTVADAEGHDGDIRWNFEKFLVDRDGNIVRVSARRSSRTPTRSSAPSRLRCRFRRRRGAGGHERLAAGPARHTGPAMAPLADLLPPPGSDPVAVLDAFAAWAADGGRPLYPHQEEAALALAAGDHVVLATPTGSGKSLVAVAGVLLARNDGRRAVWTAPIKALVAEKFFDLVDLLGAEQVGLATGDAAINADAPVLVCTAEVLANHALVTGPASDFGFACLDEFHYYGDRDRGWAWQVPLLELTELPDAAGVGDARRHDRRSRPTSAERSGRPVTEVTSVDRPTPLYHQWRMTPVADSVREAVDDGLSPVYVVHANQAAAIERAQALVSLNVTTRAAARGDRRGDGRRADGPRLRRHARPARPQRRRRAPRRDAAPLPPARRAARRRRACCR